MNFFTKIEKVPLYKEIYGSLLNKNLSEKDIPILPNLSKKQISNGFPNKWMTEELRKAISENAYEFMTTSGTSGERLQLIRPLNWWYGEEKRLFKSLNDIFPKYSDMNSKAILTTAVCSNTLCYKETPPYEKRVVNGILHLNISPDPNIWTRTDIQRMVDEIDLHKPQCLQADPVYLSIFIKLLTKYEITAPKWLPYLLLLTYEYPPKKCLKIIRNFWQIPTIIVYGTTEVGFIFHQDLDGKFRWISDSTYLFLQPLEHRKDICELLISSFRNPLMPFINYITNDLIMTDPGNAILDSKGIILQFLGRKKDMTYSASNKAIALGELDNALSNFENNILFYTLDFNYEKKIIFRFTTFDDAPLILQHQDEIKSFLNELYENAYAIELVHEKEIVPSSSGKFEIIKQKKL